MTDPQKLAAAYAAGVLVGGIARDVAAYVGPGRVVSGTGPAGPFHGPLVRAETLPGDRRAPVGQESPGRRHAARGTGGNERHSALRGIRRTAARSEQREEQVNMEHSWTRKALDKKKGMDAHEIASVMDTAPRHAHVRAVVGFRGQIQQITATWDTEQMPTAPAAREDMTLREQVERAARDR